MNSGSRFVLMRWLWCVMSWCVVLKVCVCLIYLCFIVFRYVGFGLSCLVLMVFMVVLLLMCFRIRWWVLLSCGWVCFSGMIVIFLVVMWVLFGLMCWLICSFGIFVSRFGLFLIVFFVVLLWFICKRKLCLSSYLLRLCWLIWVLFCCLLMIIGFFVGSFLIGLVL